MSHKKRENKEEARYTRAGETRMGAGLELAARVDSEGILPLSSQKPRGIHPYPANRGLRLRAWMLRRQEHLRQLGMTP